MPLPLLEQLISAAAAVTNNMQRTERTGTLKMKPTMEPWELDKWPACWPCLLALR